MALSALPSPLSLLVYVWIASTAINGLATPQVASWTPGGQSMTMVRRSRPRLSADELNAWAKEKTTALDLKFGGGSVDKRSVGTNLLTNQQFDSSYFGSIAIGTPAVSYSVILDTGSADLWLASSSSGQTSGSRQGSIPSFNSAASTSFQGSNTPFQVTYGSGAVAGVLGSDTVQFAGFEVKSQEFGLVNQVTPQLLASPVSGLMGLAFQSISSSGATPFWQAITNSAGSLDSPLMAFQLTRVSNATKPQSLEFGGTFTFGAVNNTLFTGDIDYQNIPSGAPGYWILNLSEMRIQGQSIGLPEGSGAFAAIDTGTTGIAGPDSTLTEFYAAIPGSQRMTGEMSSFWSYPCNTNVNVTLKFGSSSIAWPISGADFQLQQVNDNTCVGAFFALTSSGRAPTWIIGDTFLKNVYSVFRSSPPSVGFAALSPTAISLSDTDIPVPTPTTAPSPNSVGNDSNTSDASPSVRIPLMTGVMTFMLLVTGFAAVLVL